MNSLMCICVALWATCSAGLDSTPLAGVVVDERGGPVQNADVWLSGMEYPQATTYARAKTDDAGRFEVDVPDKAAAGPFASVVFVWARGAAGRVAWSAVNTSTRRTEPLRLVTGPRTDLAMEIVDPDGEPVADARVRAVTLRGTTPESQYAMLPDELSELLGATTDERGVAKLPDFTEEELSGVRVETKGFGTQQFGRRDDKSRLQKLSLAPTGRLVGRLTGEDVQAAAGTTFNITSFRETPDGGAAPNVFAMGYSIVKVDETGRFEVPALAAGRLTIQFQSPKDSTVRPQPPTDRSLAAGKELELEIPLKRAVRVRGVVRERGTGKPIAGARVGIVSNNVASEQAETNEEGRFEASVLPGSVVLYVFSAPKPYITPLFTGGQRSVDVSEKKGEHLFDPIELVHGTSVRGKVVDEKGGPVAGATVNAAWTMHDGNFGAPKSAIGLSDARGEFVIEGVDPTAELRLSATAKDASTDEETSARADSKDPIVLRVSTASVVAAAGRVVDRAGQPVAGATIEIWSQSRSPEGHEVSSGVVQFDGKRSLTSDDAGHFETPRQLKRGGEYRVVVRAAGMLPGGSEWMKLDAAIPT